MGIKQKISGVEDRLFGEIGKNTDPKITSEESNQANSTLEQILDEIKRKTEPKKTEPRKTLAKTISKGCFEPRKALSKIINEVYLEDLKRGLISIKDDLQADQFSLVKLLDSLSNLDDNAQSSIHQLEEDFLRKFISNFDLRQEALEKEISKISKISPVIELDNQQVFQYLDDDLSKEDNEATDYIIKLAIDIVKDELEDPEPSTKVGAYSAAVPTPHTSTR